jgi:hypothetical protein
VVLVACDLNVVNRGVVDKDEVRVADDVAMLENDSRQSLLEVVW